MSNLESIKHKTKVTKPKKVEAQIPVAFAEVPEVENPEKPEEEAAQVQEWRKY